MPIDRAQFHALFEAEHQRVFRFLWRLTGSAADADDVAQEAFLAAWRHRASFDARGSAAGWLMKTAYRTFLNHRRGEQRRTARNGHATVPERAEAAGEGLERREALGVVRAEVERALAHLAPEARAAFVLFRFEGQPVAAIAALTDTPVKTVETRIRRATLEVAASLAARRPHLPSTHP